MKNRTQKMIRALSTMVIIINLSIGLAAQGWSWIYYLNSLEANVGNKIVDISESFDGYCHAISTYDEGNNRVGIITTLMTDGGIAYTDAITSYLDDDSDYNSIIPKTIISNGIEYAIIGVDREDINTGEKRALLAWSTSREQDDSNEALLDTVFNIKSLIEDDIFSSLIYDLVLTPNGQYVALGAIYNEPIANTFAGNLVLSKFSFDGTTDWTHTYESPGDDVGIKILATANGEYKILKNVWSNTNEVSIQLMSIDASGVLSSVQNIGETGDTATDMLQTADGGFVIIGNKIDQELFVLKIDEAGVEIWQQDYAAPDRIMSGYSITEDKQQHLTVAGSSSNITDDITNAFLAKLNPDGIPLWERLYAQKHETSEFGNIITTNNGKYRMGGYAQPFSINHHLAVQTDSFGIIKGGAVHGNVFHDLNLSCLPEADELKLEGWTVQIIGDSTSYFGTTNEDGNYWIPIDVENGTTPTYTVTLITPNDYWEACVNEVVITPAYLDTIQVDFPMTSLIECPFMQATVGNTLYSPDLSSNIHINYRNTGTSIAEEASIQVDLHESMIYEGASISPSAVNGTLYTFPLGDLGINEYGELIIEISLEDSVVVDDILCIETYLFPDTICEVDPSPWPGAILQLSHNCVDGELVFTIENVGTAAMQAPQSYIIIEDAVLLMEQEFELGPGESIETETLLVNGSNYHLISPQEPGAPGAGWLSLGTDNCSTVSSTVMQYPLYAGDPFSTIHCNQVYNWSLGNGCFAAPQGITEQNMILPNTDIEYSVTFENTGIESISRVIIKDTLSEYLDPASIIPGASSHSYNFRFESDNIIVFNFYNINLSAGSSGFVNFRIAQQENLPVDTRIENKAGIYFDFVPEISTNTTFHTVSNLYNILDGSLSLANPETTVKVIPNPMQDGAWINVENIPELSTPITLGLFDISGKLVQEIQSDSHQIWLARKQLAPGLYFFSIQQANQWVANGKIIIVN